MKICSKCLEEKELTEFYKNVDHKDGLESYCKSCKKAQSANQYLATKEKDGYTADNIKILSDQEVLDDVPWVVHHSLANQYSRPLEFIQRGLEACRLSGVSSAYFINRYLEGDKTVPVNDAVAYHSKILQGKEFNNNWANGVDNF